MTIREFAKELQIIYDEMGKSFSEYQKTSGLLCLEGCGKCCNNPQVEASMLEMIPLALKILDDNKLEAWLEKLENSTQNHCLMYQPLSLDGSLGKCSVYGERPALCRMFGVAGYFNKYGKVSLSLCKLIREQNGELAKNHEQTVSEEKTPMLITWSYRLAQLDPALIQKRMPINEALQQALEKVALYAMYQSP
jgi:Fe-S-cluster containining protein